MHPVSTVAGVSAEYGRLDFDEVMRMYAAGLPFKLHEWQCDDVRTLLALDRAGVFLPVGAGKTVVATLTALGWNDPIRIVLLPPILIRQWVKWLNSIPGSGGAIAMQGTPKVRHNLPVENYRWWVMSMGVFRNDLDLLMRYLKGQDVTLVVDEAQSVKNTTTASFRAVNQFSMGRKLLLLTGTELNSPADAYAYIKLKTPLIYRSYGHYTNLHVEARDFFEKPTKWRGLDVIRQNLYLASVKRSKEEVHAHLPKANYIPIEYDLDPEHLKLYNKLANEMLLELPTGGKIDATQASSLHNALQQIVINWGHFAGEEGLRPAAFDLIDQVVDEIALGQPGSSKLIIWTWFKKTTAAVLDYCNSLFPGAAVAAYSEADSQKSVARFMDDPTCLIGVFQPGSAGAGLNPQHLCWECLFLEAPTRTIPFRQSAGRIDREGQKYNPNIRVAMAAGTLQNRLFLNLLANDKEVMTVQDETDLRAMIFGH